MRPEIKIRFEMKSILNSSGSRRANKTISQSENRQHASKNPQAVLREKESKRKNQEARSPNR
jgi:hypothetical protein